MNTNVIEPILELGELLKTRRDSPHVRLYSRTADGQLNHIGGSDLTVYEGGVPLAGDILSIRSASGPIQYSVQQRLHIDAIERIGWALIVEPVEDAFLVAVDEAWQADAESFDQAFAEHGEELREVIREAQQIEDEKASTEKIAAAERKANRQAAKIERDQRRHARLQRQAARE